MRWSLVAPATSAGVPTAGSASTIPKPLATSVASFARTANSASDASSTIPTSSKKQPPISMSNPRGYSHVVEVHRPHRVVYFAGQTGADANSRVSADFRAQAVQVFENIKIALSSVGAGFEHVVKMTAYHTNLDANAAIYREVRASYFPNKAALPGHTLLQISRLANPAYQLEVEIVAILPPKA